MRVSIFTLFCPLFGIYNSVKNTLKKYYFNPYFIIFIILFLLIFKYLTFKVKINL